MCYDHHDITMRTTLNLDEDVFSLARSLAAARGVSIGKVLSELARRGAVARPPGRSRSGFHTFAPQPGTASFGPEDVKAALERDSETSGELFLGGNR